jgi:hypothetical protein
MSDFILTSMKYLKNYFPRLYYLYLYYFKGFNPRELRNLPWIAGGAVEWLKENIKYEMKVFEYGSGGSTIFFSRYLKEFTSIEHNPIYYTLLKNRHLVNCNLIYSPARNGINKFSTTDVNYQGMNFKNYVEQIDKFPNKYFDLIYIDGRSRSQCLKHSIIKVKNNGYILLDNSEREEYQNAIKRINLIIKQRWDFQGTDGQTTIFQII